jgi:hypothetical protein
MSAHGFRREISSLDVIIKIVEVLLEDKIRASTVATAPVVTQHVIHLILNPALSFVFVLIILIA